MILHVYFQVHENPSWAPLPSTFSNQTTCSPNTAYTYCLTPKRWLMTSEGRSKARTYWPARLWVEQCKLLVATEHWLAGRCGSHNPITGCPIVGRMRVQLRRSNVRLHGRCLERIAQHQDVVASPEEPQHNTLSAQNLPPPHNNHPLTSV